MSNGVFQERSNCALFLGRGVYDYLEATVVEGLKESGWVVYGIHKSNYVTNIIDPRNHGKSYSLVITNKENHGLVKRESLLAPGGRLLFIDGRDDPYIFPLGLITSSAYLKRELLPHFGKPSKLVQLGFGVERRYLIPPEKKLWGQRPNDVFCAVSVSTNKARQAYLASIERDCKFLGVSCVTEPTGERAYDNKSGAPLPTPKYHQAMSDSKVAISLFGAGQDCARFWESLAKGALLLAERPTIAASIMPVHGQHCLYFQDTEELSKLLSWIFKNPEASAEIASAGHEWAVHNRKPAELWRRANQRDTQWRNRWGPEFFHRIFLACWASAYNVRAFFYLYWFKNLRHLRVSKIPKRKS